MAAVLSLNKNQSVVFLWVSKLLIFFYLLILIWYGFFNFFLIFCDTNFLTRIYSGDQGYGNNRPLTMNVLERLEYIQYIMEFF
jgi:hypothetical protein